MKTFTYTLKEQSALDIINFDDFKEDKHILVQIFCGEGKDRLLSLSREIKRLLPLSCCIGTTTDGEIEKDFVYTFHSTISISIFEHTLLKSAYVKGKDSFQNGVKLAKKLLSQDSKLFILFSDGTTTNGEAFVKGIEYEAKDIIIAGAMAGDNGQFIQTYVLENDRLISEGAVGVSLNSKLLHVDTDYRFNWSSIGIYHKIDRVEGNRVYSIDGISAVDFYTKYLGEGIAKALPATGIEFPLIIKRNGVRTARAVIAKHEDQSLSFAGNLEQNELVKFGFGNAELIMRDSFSNMQRFDAETFFIYTCMARRRYMPNLTQLEIKPFASIAPTIGFFSYGEFFHRDGYNQLLNQTITVVALSELDHHNISFEYKKEKNLMKAHSDHAKTLQALTHLINQSSKDYMKQSQKLEEEKQYSHNLLQSQKLFLRHTVHETNTFLSVLMANIELFEMDYSQNSYLSNITSATKNIFIIYDDLSYLIQKDKISYPQKEIDLIDYIRSRIDFFQEVASGARVSLELICSFDELIIYFNETKLQRIIDNNLTNAIKYTKENEKISILISKKDGLNTIVFESKSRHIQDIEKVFDAYYRESKESLGLGLGLNLVKQICDEAGIEIILKSTKDKTSFLYKFKERRSCL